MTPISFLDEPDLRRWRACPRLHWLHRQGAAPTGQPPRVGDSAEAAAALRASYAGAREIAAPRDDADWVRAVAQTQLALAELSARPDPEAALLGACLASDDGARCRIDVMQRGARGWRLWRLRLGTVADAPDVDALAWAAHVAARAGWRLQSVGLLLIDTDFLYPGLGCYAGLFREVDVGPMLGSRPVAEWLVALQRSAHGREPPMPLVAPCAADGGCAYADHCHAGEPAPAAVPPAQALEILGRERAEQLRLAGHRSVLDVPLTALPQPRLRRAARAVQQGAPVREPGVAALAAHWPRPWRFLRIETIGLAVPIWSGTRPYQILPFQWTLGEATADGGWTLQQHLAEGQSDPRTEVVQRLLAALPPGGTLFAYQAGFERNRLRELAQRVPAQAARLEALAAGLVDVFALGRAHAYHPDQAGSWSARALWRAVLPGLGAQALDEPGLRSPLQAYGLSLRADTAPERRAALRAVLARHGERQVRALQAYLAWLIEAG
ncbi:DUF2779 domain-containing protein [Ideonella sp. 4Y11]|uniref:DUF2779 domain-containing protein n=2 Tax=Ideonella TaxID=36862 RepID=A0A940YJD4_9BURK|nr:MULTISPECIES: DUF2779 domain-containing protein [Ideonella]MBQ0933049.1 DUF2779 domain-containing protein [Ideonella alba]MBQ0961145.1 DUF2779 domain-containing protein [Ideonella aquatica]